MLFRLDIFQRTFWMSLLKKLGLERSQLVRVPMGGSGEASLGPGYLLAARGGKPASQVLEGS